MATRSHSPIHPPTASSLLPLVSTYQVPDPDDPDGFAHPSVFGFEPVNDGIDVHVGPLPRDDRAIAAGLFGMRADPAWSAVAASFSGVARHPAGGDPVGRADASVVVDRNGDVASALRLDGRLVPNDHDEHPPQGLTIDALHRMLGVPSPGRPPRAELFALAVWSELLVQHATDGCGTSWTDAVSLHPGEPGHPARSRGRPSQVDPSVETVVEATMRCAQQMDWSRLHRRAVAGQGPADLTPDEIEWMDATLYARWLLGSFPDPRTAAEVLRAHGDEHAASGLLAVTDAVMLQVGGPDEPNMR